MRDIKCRVDDYLARIMPQVAAALGDAWTAEHLTILDDQERPRFKVMPCWYFHTAGTAIVFPAWTTGSTERPTIRVPATPSPHALARAIRQDLMPRAPLRPPVRVRLSGRGARAAGYLDATTFEELAPHTADAVAALLAREQPQGFGITYLADLSPDHARALLENWSATLEDAHELAAGDRRALERARHRLAVHLEYYDRYDRY